MDAEALNKFFWKLIVTSGGGFLTIVGLITMFVWRKKLWTMLFGDNVQSAPITPNILPSIPSSPTPLELANRRREDEMLERFMVAYERNTDAFVNTAKAQQRTADILEQFKEELKTMSGRIDRLAQK